MTCKIKLETSAVFALIVLATGCGQKEEIPAPAASAPQKSTVNAATDNRKAADADKAVQALNETADAARKSAAKVAADAQSQLAGATSKVQSLIDTARKLSGENKWTEALNILNQLASQRLTPEQQAVVDGIKQQAQKQAEEAVAKKAAAEAAKAVGGLLNPKK